MKKQENPLVNALEAYTAQNKIRMHMPGHKGGRLFSKPFCRSILRYDVTEIPGMDNFHHPKGILSESMNACARAFGAIKSYFLVNGSTSGIHAMLAAALNRGDKLLVSRNCHISVIHGLILFGVQPVYVMPQYDEDWHLVLPSDINVWKKAIEENPDAKGALVTSPDYYGLCTEMKELALFLHQRDKFILVDEAHGAHFAFSDILPETALQQGVDLCVQSIHKTMPALTQAALLHIGSNRIPADRVERAVSMLTTTSPSYMIMASMDYARGFAEYEGEDRYRRLFYQLHQMKQELLKMKKLRLVPDEFLCFKRDATRIVVDTFFSDITGYEMSERLAEEYDIMAEMADEFHVVLILTLVDTEKEINALITALQDLDNKIKVGSGEQNLTRFDAEPLPYIMPELSDYLQSSMYISLDSACGYTSASLVTPYPPGVPVLCPGEKITENIIEHICRLMSLGCDVQGITENTIRVMPMI